MRRSEKSILERSSLDEIIHQALVCHLSCCLDDQPYIIPLSFGYDGKTVYFHTAKSGKKIDIWRRNPRVSLGFETRIDLVADPVQACKWSFNFQSVIAEGIIQEITDPERKKKGLNHIMSHYSGKEWSMPDLEIGKTKVWDVVLDTISGKRSPALSPDH